MNILIRNISALAVTSPGLEPVRGKELAQVSVLPESYLLIKNGRIDSFGPDSEAPVGVAEEYDAKGGIVLPGFVDCHTHLVFAASREKEFVMKIHGATYSEIAKAGGGILNSAAAVSSITEDELFERSEKRLQELIRKGTTAIEIKSGYGLSTEAELKMLRVARRLGKTSGIPVKTTFLGAHAVPSGMDKKDYLNLILSEMIPAVVNEGLADFIDVFCEKGFFDPEESLVVLEAGKKAGMIPRVHANQLGNSGGVQVAVQAGAVSADHLEHLGEEEIKLLQQSFVMPIALPGAAFFLRMPYTPARQLVDAGLPIAIASDYNPGSSPSGNMMMMWSLACIGMRLTPEEALHALTVNPALVLGIQNTHGSIAVGKVGSVIITKPVTSLAYLPYHYAMDAIEKVVVSGRLIN